METIAIYWIIVFVWIGEPAQISSVDQKNRTQINIIIIRLHKVVVVVVVQGRRTNRNVCLSDKLLYDVWAFKTDYKCVNKWFIFALVLVKCAEQHTYSIFIYIYNSFSESSKNIYKWNGQK